MFVAVIIIIIIIISIISYLEKYFWFVNEGAITIAPFKPWPWGIYRVWISDGPVSGILIQCSVDERDGTRLSGFHKQHVSCLTRREAALIIDLSCIIKRSEANSEPLGSQLAFVTDGQRSRFYFSSRQREAEPSRFKDSEVFPVTTRPCSPVTSD